MKKTVAMLLLVGLLGCLGGCGDTESPTPSTTESLSATTTTAEGSSTTTTTKAAAFTTTTTAKVESSTTTRTSQRRSDITSKKETSGTTGTGTEQTNPESIIYSDNYGVSFAYDPDAFEIEYTDDGATFPLKSSKNEEGRFLTHLSVSVMEDETLQDLRDGLILQSRTDDVEVNETHIGQDSVPATTIFYERDVYGENYHMFFYLVQGDGFVVMIEVSSAEGADIVTSDTVSELIQSFKLE